MSDAELEKTIVEINISTIPDALLKAEGEVLKFDGFLAVYMESTDDDDAQEEAKGRSAASTARNSLSHTTPFVRSRFSSRLFDPYGSRAARLSGGCAEA